MCGLAGVVDFTRPPAAHRERALAMRARLRHRGPDGEGEHVAAAHAMLVHVRLAIVDVAGGAQPMVSRDGRYVIVYNGELANADALRTTLDYPFRTRSDTEVVLAAYVKWGAGAALRLSGMFAFFVWDTRLERGFGARDRLGVKPLFFAKEDGAFVFASEAHAIARTRSSVAGPNVAGILEVLVAPAFSGVEHAMFADVTPLLPGHTLQVDRDGLRTESYWDWPCDPQAARDTDSVRVVTSLREALPRAMDRALVSNVPIGLFSSGGIDSAIVAHAMAKRAATRVAAYTITFDDQAGFDYARSTITSSNDTPYARDVAEALGLDARLVHLRRDEIARDLHAIAIANDALPAWEQELAQHRLACAAAASLKVVAVGDAADETHYGYHFLLDEAALRGPGAVLARLGSVPIARAIAVDAERLAASHLQTIATAGGARFGVTREESVLAMTYLIVKRWLPRLLHNGDIHTMRASLEARVPFADVELLELAAQISPAVALRGGVEKWALREAARGLVPEHVRTRRKSALPKDLEVEPVFRAEALRVLREPPALVEALVDLDAVRAIAERPSTLTEAERAILFRVITFVHWTRHHEVAAP